MWFNPCAFLFVKGQFGNEGRNALNGPGYTNWDFSLMKTVTWAEKRKLEMRFEAYNILNHPNFDFPDRLLGDATFGHILSSNGYGGRPPRQIQLGAKIYF